MGRESIYFYGGCSQRNLLRQRRCVPFLGPSDPKGSLKIVTADWTIHVQYLTGKKQPRLCCGRSPDRGIQADSPQKSAENAKNRIFLLRPLCSLAVDTNKIFRQKYEEQKNRKESKEPPPVVAGLPCCGRSPTEPHLLRSSCPPCRCCPSSGHGQDVWSILLQIGSSLAGKGRFPS